MIGIAGILGTKKKQIYQSCLSLNPFSALHQWAQTMSMHPLMRLENESKSGAISAYLFLPRPLNENLFLHSS
jgi:hypothetical protein